LGDQELTLLEAVKLARLAHDGVEGSRFLTPRPDAPLFISVDLYAEYVLADLKRRYNNDSFQLIVPGVCPSTPDFYGMSAIFPDQRIAAYTYTMAKSFCWQRFVSIKELSHHLSGVYQGLRDNVSADPMLTMAQLSRDGLPSETEKLSPEQFGLCVALEVSMPWGLREHLAKCWRDSEPMKAAESSRVPFNMIYFMYDVGYAELSDKINRSI